ncbi:MULTISPECIES: alpha/beta fold hydrolase [unclassified Acidovorax]|uniref:alpha/beta fold hydrolase n=1 Tax=unclassified Acidovorax TaxID=2684926 RepID=UPI001C44EF73|nr:MULTISPECIES: alpha/beta fold hydrolase [unclassified Acidovorax]MBV7428522.1 alpha/beta fold hydrolase [Acidovorax sp. sif0732]MBV7450348.1 alpha/beta fold hydrolase [Acidovorax sp. sif0715]
MIQTRSVTLPHGITLHCRVTGVAGRPVLLLLHGFPEGAFIWDELLLHFARPENGGYRCIAPYLRGFGPSSSPAEAEAYRAKHLVQDLAALIAAESPGGPLECLVAHDWGGAVAWNLANQQPGLMKRLAIINSPHPGTFLRELQHSPAQQAASQYMHFLCRPDAEALLAENDFRRLFGFFDAPDGRAPAWLTESVRAQYRALWQQGLTGACNYYRASPLRPPREGDDSVQAITLPDSMLTVAVPTLVLWAMDDPALLPGLLDGLPGWIPQLQLHRVEQASHWVVHEHPERVAMELRHFLQQK